MDTGSEIIEDNENREAEIKAVIAERLRKLGNDIEHMRTENLQWELDNIVQFLMELELLTGSDVCFEVIQLVGRAVKLVSEETYVCNKLPLEYSHLKGRPSFRIPKETLIYYIENEFTIEEIANMLSVSRRTVINRMQDFELSVRAMYTKMSDEELDQKVAKKVEEFPNSGFKTVLGHLRADGIRIQGRRVMQSMRRVDPFGVMVRKMFMKNYRIKRRTYSVRAPNALWHVDSNHKLIRWRFIIHGGIDGFSRLPTYIKIRSDNKAKTALEAFLLGVNEFGLPDRVRTDKGMENVLIAEHMLRHRGLNNNSHITGRSVHNQRIERFWREVWHGCTGAYYQLFSEMERSGDLNVDSEPDLCALHVVFLERIQDSLDRFCSAVARRPLRTENNRSPLQLWIMGQVFDHRIHLSDEDAVMYGVDLDGPVDLNPEANVVVPALVSVPDNIMETVNQIKNQGECSAFGTETYLRVKEYLLTENLFLE